MDKPTREELLFSEFWDEFCALAGEMGAAPLNKRRECWTVALDSRWWLAVNGQNYRVHALSPTGIRHPVPPFSVYVEFNGWPAGLIDPHGASIAAGSLANIGTLVEAVKAKRQSIQLPEAHHG